MYNFPTNGTWIISAYISLPILIISISQDITYGMQSDDIRKN